MTIGTITARVIIRACLLLTGVSCLGSAQFASAEDCMALKQLQFHKARVTLVKLENAGTLAPLLDQEDTTLREFCRVVVQAKPSARSNVQIEVWLPLHGWNSRLLGLGSGGFGGIIEYGQLSDALRGGYVAATTDMGTSPASPTQADALIGEPEKWKDFGYRATHTMTVIAKRLVVTFYGKGAEFSYFSGCSTGGQQGLQEAQRFPADYDGIVSGAPAYARTRLHTAILWNYRELSSGVNAGFTHAKLALLSTAMLHACGTYVEESSLVQVINPAACVFDPELLRCTKANEENCLSSEDLNIIKRVHAGPKTPSGRQIYPGLAWGSEAGWNLPPAQKNGQTVPFASIFRWVWGLSWKWTSFDFDGDVVTLDQRLGPWLNATDPDLAKFRQLGHKMLLYHGWADPLVAPQGSIDYFEQVMKKGERSGTQPLVVSSTRLYMIPGMAHCGGGTGPAHLDLLPSLRAWVESGVVPEKITVAPFQKGAPSGTQLLCPYPVQAQADPGSGALMCAAGR